MEAGATYFIELADSWGDGWGAGNLPSYLMITVGSIRIFKGMLPYSSSRNAYSTSYTFVANFVASPISDWKYTDVAQTSNAWTQASFSDASWSTATGNSFPDFTSTTRYYRFTGNLPNRANIPTVHTSINNKYGFVSYLQGTEVYRYHIPAGAVSPTTPATESDGTYSVAVSANKFLLPASGSFTVCFEVHLTSGTSGGQDPFNGVIFIGASGEEASLGENVFYGGVTSGEPEGPSGFTLSKIFDEALSTYYYSQSSATLTAIYQFNSGRAEWINYYSIMSAITISYGYPASWTLYGSNDGNTWDTLDIQSGIVFPSASHTIQFPLRANVKSYNRFKFAFTSSASGQIGVGLISGYIGIFANEATGLAYDVTSFTGYAGADAVTMTPIVNGYQTFTSTPPLPQGVTLNPTTGVISGVPAVAGSATYTISAISIITSQPSQTQITLNAQPCTAPSRLIIRFVKVSQSWASEESYTITDSAGTVYNSPVFSDMNTQYMLYCLPAGTINVHLADSYNDGWSQNSRLHIQMSDGEGDFYSIASIYESRDGAKDFTYEISYKIFPKSSSSWTYSTNLVSNWYGVGSVSGFTAYDAANPPASNGKYVWFFRATVPITVTGYEGFELRVKARAGYVVYINGVEFIRKNLPAGDISASTGATGGEPVESYRFISGPNSAFTAGNNVIAIGIVNLSGSNPTTMTFDATLRQIKPNAIGRVIDAIPSATPSGSGLSALTDLSTYTYWNAEQPTKADFIIDLTFGTHRAEHFNKHCVTSSTMTDAYDPSDWAIYGSSDGLTFELLGNVTNAYFSARTTTRCFFLPNNRKAYSQYRMVVTETAVPTAIPYGLAIAELTFSMVDLDQLVVPAFSLDSNSYTGYVGVPFPEVTPSSDLFSDYTITPALQLPLELDTSTGSIRGTPNTLMPRTTYTISAKTPKGETVTTQVSLAVENCLYPNNQFSILIQAGTAGAEMGFKLKDSNGSILVDKNKFTNNQANYYPQCRATGIYTLTLTDSGYNGWDTGYFRVLLADESVVLLGSLGDNEYTKDFTFYIGYLVTPIHESYKFLNSGSAAPADWTQVQSTSAGSWQEAKPGSFGNFAGTTAYFRKTFNVDNLNTYAALAFTVKTTYGVIVYINGKQVYSYNMPQGTITHTTRCSVKLNQLMNVGSSIVVQYSDLIVGTNVICFEVHVADPAATNAIDFDSTLQFTADGSYRVLDGAASSDIDADEEVKKMFDNVKGSVYVSGPRCVGATPTWSYNNDKREFISSYTIITGPNCNVRAPSAWRFEGSNDGIHWSILHEVTGELFTVYSKEKTYDFYNNKVFSKYRMVVTECANTEIYSYGGSCDINGSGSGTGFQLAELGMYAKRLQAACEPTNDGFRGAVEGQYAYKDCDQYYQGRYRAMCTAGQLTNIENNCSPMAVYGIEYGSEYFTITQKSDFSYTPVVKGAEYTCSISPSLPAGITFDAGTGRISGRYDEVNSFTFTVTCGNSAGKYETKIILSFIEKTGLNLWVWIVLVILILIIVGVAVLCILNRLKSKKSRAGHNKLDKKTSSRSKASSKRGGDGSSKAVKV